MDSSHRRDHGAVAPAAFVLHCEDVHSPDGRGPVVYDVWLVAADRYEDFRFGNEWPSTAIIPDASRDDVRAAWDAGGILKTRWCARWVPCDALTRELLLEAGRRWAAELGYCDAVVTLGDRNMWRRD